MNKIEINILTIILIEAIFLLYFFKMNFLNIIVGTIIGLLLIKLISKIKINNNIQTILSISLIPFYLLTIYKTASFIQNNILKDYSLFIIIVSLLLLSIYLTKKSYHVFIKSTEILFYILLIIKIISFILCLPLININKLTIHIQLDYQAIYIAIVILFLYLCILSLTKYKINNSFIVLSLVNPFYLKLMSLLIIGNTLTNIYQYPYISYLKNIEYFDFTERIDGILSFEYLFCFIILLSFILLNIKQIKKPT